MHETVFANPCEIVPSFLLFFFHYHKIIQNFCLCMPGRNCDTCIDNYYGAPTQLGGTCQPCICNNNINPDDPGSCDGTTGECLKCLYNTEGFACEHCRSGYFGDATQQNCARK